MTDTKPWFMSRTIWGSLIALITALVTTTGVEIEPGTPDIWTEAVLQFATVVASLFAIFGRLNATSEIG